MIAPSLQTEGKQLQTSQAVGMGSRGAAVGAHGPAATDAPAAEKTPALAQA
jgi:IMP dehydrogenase